MSFLPFVSLILFGIHVHQICTVAASSATTAQYDFVISRAFATPDCVEKLVLTINGEFPGPEIRVSPAQRIEIHVRNHLPTEAVTIHWHGQHQLGTPFMDGIAKISQCPIPPYSSFTYNFTVNDEAGTYFYHIHTGALIEAGAYGPFIIEEEDDDTSITSLYTSDFTMLVSDHYHRETYESLFNLLSASGSFRWVFDPNSILINGKAIYDCYDNDDYTCNETNSLCTQTSGDEEYTVCGAHQRKHTRFRAYGSGGCDDDADCEYTEFVVSAGNTYLFRIINPSPLSHLNVMFDQHSMTVISIDGYATEAVQVDSIDLHSGQRVEVLVTMNDDAAAEQESFWITAQIRSRSGIRQGRAILRYGSSDSDPPSGDIDNITHPDWDDFNYTRAQQEAYTGTSTPPLSSEVESRIVFLSTQERFDMGNANYFNGDDISSFDITDMSTIIGTTSRPEDNCNSESDDGEPLTLRWAMNRETFMMPETPSLLHLAFQSESFESMAAEHPASYVKVEFGKVYDLVFQNYAACNGVCETHSIHLHGHIFWVLGHFEGEWAASDEQIDVLCSENCPRRDSVFLLPDRVSYEYEERAGCGYTVVRFVADSPGVWPVHCHQSWHFLMGKVALIYYNSSDIDIPDDVSDVSVCGGDVSAVDVAKRYLVVEEEEKDEEEAKGGLEGTEIVVLALGLAVIVAVVVVGVVWYACTRKKEDKEYESPMAQKDADVEIVPVNQSTMDYE